MTLHIRYRTPAEEYQLPGMPERLQQIYAARGCTQLSQLEKGLKSLQHYQHLKGIQAAVTCLADAIAQQKKVVIVGDFDADGATSTALCLLALKRLGANNYSYLVPNRFDFGYGLSPEIVEMAAEQQADLIMTVDNGISCFAGVEKAKALGLQVVITDHHLPADTLPSADAIVNPNQPGCEFLSKNLAGVGVAFYLMLALKQELQQRGWFEQQGVSAPNFAELLDLVALGTVADVVPLDENNRVLVYQGLQRIRSGYCRPGIKAMLDIANRSGDNLVASDLGFVLGPRLNAAGRLDDMALGIECLLCEEPGRARQMAMQLDSLNRERREIEAGMQQEAIKALELLKFSQTELPFAISLYQADWHQGVIGIVAGRIKDKYFRPTVAFAHDNETTLKGSARSIPGLHIRDLLEEINSRYPGVIKKFGGHAMAAGLSLELSQLPVFETVFQQVAQEWLQDKALQGEVLSDGQLQAGEYSLEFAQLLREAGPWGQAFPEPVFDDSFELVQQRIVGEKHLKLLLKHNSGTLLDAIAFNVDLASWPNPNAMAARVAFKLDINQFRGKSSLQLMVEGIEAIAS